MDLSFDFDRNFMDLRHNENTSGLHVLVHCSMLTEVVEIFPFFLYFSQLGRYYRRTFFPSCFLVAAAASELRWLKTVSSTFQNLDFDVSL